MSDPKRATLITVGATKSAKNNVTKTVRLAIDLVESNESKYPELNYKELVIAEVRKKKIENNKTAGLDPFSDNDDDVERVAKKFEQKYGGKSTYGRKGKTKHDEFADIGAGYDENDPFIDNTDGYDEMIPPECDTLYGGFYINSGSLEFKNVPENQLPSSDTEHGNRRHKRRISSSSSSEESSDSSSESSPDEKDTKPQVNGTDSHKTEHRKKKNKKMEKKAKRICRTDSAATSGKQTSDDNVQNNDESDSRTSHSDSMTSKPAPSSENVVTSDSSRDVADSKVESSLPTPIRQVIEDLKCHIARLQLASPNIPFKDIDAQAEPFLIKLDCALLTSDCTIQKSAWSIIARLLNTNRNNLAKRVKNLVTSHNISSNNTVPQTQSQPAPTPIVKPTTSQKRKRDELNDITISKMSSAEKEAKIADFIARLKALIEEKRPGMIANYNAECIRVQEERKKMQQSVPNGPHIEKRLPKRRFPWCQKSRHMLVMLSRLAGDHNAAIALLANRVLPMFPKGFVRMPTLLKQADLKTMAVTEVKRHKSAPTPQTQTQNIVHSISEIIQFPSSLTVTTTKPDRTEPIEEKKDRKTYESQFSAVTNSFNLSKDNQINDKKIKETDSSKNDKYIPPNSIGSITITPVNSCPKPDKIISNASTTKINPVAIFEKQKEPLIRVKTPAALMKEANEIACKEKDKMRKEKSKEKRVASPLSIETNFISKEKAKPSPKSNELIVKHIDSVKSSEDKLPRPALIPVHHSPTFAKPDKRPEPKKKKEVVIVSDLDPLAINEIDDSSSDVEVIENSDVNKISDNDKVKSDNKLNKVIEKCDLVPSKDKSVIQCVNTDVKLAKAQKMDVDDSENKNDIDAIMRNLKELQDSQQPNFTSSYGGVITSDLTTLDNMDGCSTSEVNVS